MPASWEDAERAERIMEVFEAVFEVNKRVPIIVEGKRDAEALAKLGLVGEIIPFNRGVSIYEFCDDIAARYRRVVLLPDWDREGEDLMRKLGEELVGCWEEFSRFREILKALCQKEIKDVEGIPGLLRRLSGDDGAWR